MPRRKKNDTVVILNTTGNLYSGQGYQTLESDFKKDVVNAMINAHKCSDSLKCLSIPNPIGYASNNDQSIQTALSKALVGDRPDLLFFSGYAGDLQTLLDSLPAGKKLTILGGDALSIMNDYTRPLPENVYFTSFASPATWHDNTPPQSVQTFLNDFSQTFGTPVAPDGVQGVDADVLLGYDALQVFLQGYQNALSSGKTAPSPNDLAQGIRQINAAHPYQGVSGRIAFSDPADKTAPIDKRVVLEHVVSNQLHILDHQGCLLINDTNCG